MSDDRAPALTSAAELRHAFDRSFAEALPASRPALVDLLAIRVGREPYALRLGEVAALYVDRKVTPVPGGAPALLGIAGFRGAIVPVYDLQLLLGHHADAATRWLAMAADGAAAFAFAGQEGQLRVPPETIVLEQQNAASHRHVREFVRTTDAVRPVVDLLSVLDAVRRLLPANLDQGER